MQRIAPNNNLPATHFIEVFHSPKKRRFQKSNIEDCKIISHLQYELNRTVITSCLYTIAIFRIRENKLPTLHKF